MACHIHVSIVFQIIQSFAVEPSFEENYRDMVKVLDSIGKQMITDQNESFALKVHYLSYLMQQYSDHSMQTLLKRSDITFPAYVLEQQLFPLSVIQVTSSQ